MTFQKNTLPAILKDFFQQGHSRFSIIILIVLLILAIVLRGFGLDRSLGGFDENHYLLYFGFSPLKEIANSYFSASNHVFHTLLMRLTMLGFGEENEIAVRSVSFISGILCLGLIYKLALRIYGSIWIARTSLLIAAVCPVHILYSQTARGYGLMMFLSACTVYFALKVLEGEGKIFSGPLGCPCSGSCQSTPSLPTAILFSDWRGGCS
ncbi:MAG: glycosyltransferase family 39 protein [Nitrospinota bacterium]|nr:glycosyltransferase family 39 protein [Nitrospinota bacterium]